MWLPWQQVYVLPGICASPSEVTEANPGSCAHSSSLEKNETCPANTNSLTDTHSYMLTEKSSQSRDSCLFFRQQQTFVNDTHTQDQIQVSGKSGHTHCLCQATCQLDRAHCNDAALLQKTCYRATGQTKDRSYNPETVTRKVLCAHFYPQTKSTTISWSRSVESQFMTASR